MMFVVLGPLCNKQTHTKVSARHNDQYQVDTRATIALLTMPLSRPLEVRKRLNMLKPERTDPGLCESRMALLLPTQVVCSN